MKDWQEKKLSELLTQRKEQVFINPDTEYHLVTISNKGDVRLREKKKGAVINAPKGYIARAGDFIYSRLSAHTGAFGIVPQELDNALITSEMPCFEIDKEQIHPQILLDLIRLPNSLWRLKQLTKGMGRVRIKENMILSLSLVLPPSAEQGKLVGRIDRIKNNQSNLKTELTNQQTLLKKLRQQILQEAIEGKLTADWRAKNSPPQEGCPQGGVVHSRNTKNYLKLPFNPKLKQRAKELRKAGNLSEVLFWNQVKRKQFKGLDFDRQKIIGNYIVDFYCSNYQVVIEIDGSSHDDKQKYDAAREAYLQRLGLQVIHILDIDIKKNLSGVMEWLDGREVFQPPRQASPATPPKEGNWEPASELLKRIQTEKQQLVEDKKIKQQKPLPPISEEEKSFDLPEGWEWCRLRDIAMINPRNAVDDDLDVGFTPMHLVSSNWCEHPKHELRKWGSVKKGFTHFANADVVVAKITPCFENSKAGIIKDFPSGIGAGTTELHVVRRLTGDISPRYLYLLLKTSKFLENGKKLMKGAVGQKRVPKDYLENLILSLPPLLEQKAIVSKAEKLLTLCDRLETQITSNQNHAEQLMRSVLTEAFGTTNH